MSQTDPTQHNDLTTGSQPAEQTILATGTHVRFLQHVDTDNNYYDRREEGKISAHGDNGYTVTGEYGTTPDNMQLGIHFEVIERPAQPDQNETSTQPGDQQHDEGDTEYNTDTVS
jgi:hypothetical protein